ncbi:MAG TPA: hypothetical protein VI968_04120 [archaeon]|nr:hypothetical protein [archaeon]
MPATQLNLVYEKGDMSVSYNPIERTVRASGPLTAGPSAGGFFYSTMREDIIYPDLIEKLHAEGLTEQVAVELFRISEGRAV